MQTFAIKPFGIGKPVGIRTINLDWPLVEGEQFKVAADDIQILRTKVLAEDGLSLRPGTPQELAPRRLVPKSVIVDRLNAAGKLGAARVALDANLYARERWYAPDRPAIYFDDPEALALLAAIGADAETILAP